MSKHYTAADHRKWEAAGLEDYADFADCVTFCNCVTFGDDTEEGEWYYIDPTKWTIYYGTFGNDNSPGASHYTYAEVYGEEEAEQFHTDGTKWEQMPEYIDSDDEDDSDEE